MANLYGSVVLCVCAVIFKFLSVIYVYMSCGAPKIGLWKSAKVWGLNSLLSLSILELKFRSSGFPKSVFT